jgi:uncharacterized metal-binding protein
MELNMNCTHCGPHACQDLMECKSVLFDRNEALNKYQEADAQNTVQAAAELVDGGRAGTLNRLEEILEFSASQGYNHLGLAYCYGMLSDARLISDHIRKAGFKVSAVSCTTGGLAQDQVNNASSIHKVSCNPLGQAMQLNAEKTQLNLAVGLCLGHDMILQNQLEAPVTTLVVKDRTSEHNPIQAIRNMPR